MGFHWVTFLAQILNLFVLVWLMKRFLYQPIINVVAKRQAYIEGKVKNAEEAALMAEKKQAQLTKQSELWQKDKQKRINDMYAEINQLRQEQNEHVRLETEALRQKMQDDLNRETAAKELEIRNIMIQNFMALSRQVLSDMSGLTPMTQSLILFQKKIADLPKDEVTRLQKAAQKVGFATVDTSDTLTAQDKKELTHFLEKFLQIKDIRYAIQHDLILGVEVTVGENVLEWNLKNYLDTFENNLNTALSGLIIKE